MKIMINIQYCFLWSLLASRHPCNNNYPNLISNYRQHFNELFSQGFDFPNGFKRSDVHIFEKLNNSTIDLVELGFVS